MLKWQTLCYVNLATVKKNGKRITLATEWRIDVGFPGGGESGKKQKTSSGHGGSVTWCCGDDGALDRSDASSGGEKWPNESFLEADS